MRTGKSEKYSRDKDNKSKSVCKALRPVKYEGLQEVKSRNQHKSHKRSTLETRTRREKESARH